MAQYKDIFKIKHNDLRPGKGKILISEPFLQDAYFQRSVVLLVEHNQNGSMGFVVNKPTGLIVNDFFPELKNIRFFLFILAALSVRTGYFSSTHSVRLFPAACRLKKIYILTVILRR
ncbi:YqgE/AlgH family protein [Tannerella sp.]|uniref:YqgE/AlgH family protein n=1 Tax=Tannerella sp. TaxID=2382127 RepID=UPI0026DDA197|nr:YqgE/AlgH family protein [Tannerella sp.]MDO4704287.1 YqgE/AlgH family protein [Tannerella sp.]